MAEQNEDPQVFDSMLHVRTTSRQKSGWVKQAQRERMNLESWVTKTLDKAVAKNDQTDSCGQ